MNKRILAVLAIAAGSLVVSACGKSSPPAADSKPAPAPVAQASEQPASAAPLVAVAAPVAVPVAVPVVAPAVAVPVAAPVAVAPAPIQLAPAPRVDKLTIQGYSSQVPAGWTPSQTSSPMRIAQFNIPAAKGVEAGEVAFYFFPTGQGGPQEANIERWTSQFTTIDGKPVAPKVSTSKNGDTTVTEVELTGTYARGVGMGPTGEAKLDQILLVAMIETSTGRITIQMYGPSKTVAAQRDGFLKLAKGFRRA